MRRVFATKVVSRQSTDLTTRKTFSRRVLMRSPFAARRKLPFTPIQPERNGDTLSNEDQHHQFDGEKFFETRPEPAFLSRLKTISIRCVTLTSDAIVLTLASPILLLWWIATKVKRWRTGGTNN